MQANLLRELNATSTSEIGGLDYDTIIGAYDKINIEFFFDVPEEHALVILSHFVHDMSSEELILRQSAYRLLLLFVEFCGRILDEEAKSEKEGCWSSACIQQIINKFLLKHMGDAMNKEAAVQKVYTLFFICNYLVFEKLPFHLYVMCELSLMFNARMEVGRGDNGFEVIIDLESLSVKSLDFFDLLLYEFFFS